MSDNTNTAVLVAVIGLAGSIGVAVIYNWDKITGSRPAQNYSAVPPPANGTREQAALDQAAREQATRDQAARDQAARDQAARDQVARDQAARDQAASAEADRKAAELRQALADTEAIQAIYLEGSGTQNCQQPPVSG